jgi:mitogen-activated protein kinase 15
MIALPVLTEYVATRWYRAPEILLGSQRYQKAVDMWSIGCILGEMLVNKAIFPGTSTLNQVELIIDLLGKPTESDVESIQAPLAAHVLQNIPVVRKQNLKSVFANASEDALDFLKRLLLFNPNKRLTVEQALNHPYMKDFVGTEEETVMPALIRTFMNDNIKYSTSEYRTALYQHIGSKYRDALVCRTPSATLAKRTPTNSS